MIDGPGPWGTGPFVLAEGYSSLDNEKAVIHEEPYAATWLPVREDRTPRVRLVANPNYWDKKRGPRLQEVIFRNDLSPEQALKLVCSGEGEVDIVTEVPSAEAARVEQSDWAKLVSIDAIRAVAGVINRNSERFPLGDQRARLALNLAIDRDEVVRKAMHGRAYPLAGLTPPSAATFLHRLSPYSHDEKKAADLWREAAGVGNTVLRITTTDKFEAVARTAAAHIGGALGVQTEVMVHRDADQIREDKRKLAEKKAPLDWDIFILQQTAQAADAPPMELHRAFVGETGEYRAGPVIPEFEDLYNEFTAQTSTGKIAQMAHRIDRYVYGEALALFLCAPQALYAVNKHVDFTPYRTTFELAQCKVSAEHWSRRA